VHARPVTMKAIVQDRYGSPDVLELREIDRPVVGDEQVLVRVQAAGVDQGVWHEVAGLPYLFRVAGIGVRAPKNPVPGHDVAGTVEAVGEKVTGFRPGDEVFGTCRGAFAGAAEATKVIEIDLDTRLFLHWHRTTVQMGWAAPRAFIVFVLLQHAPDQIPADIGVPRFLRGTVSTEIEQMLDAMAANDQLWQLLGGAPVDLAERVEALRAAIRAAGRAARAELGLPGD
jgi:Alcohol dehydrogenase GroES-like domain